MENNELSVQAMKELMESYQKRLDDLQEKYLLLQEDYAALCEYAHGLENDMKTIKENSYGWISVGVKDFLRRNKKK